MQELTDLENPNSVVQMKQWLSDNGMEVDSLGKKEVAAMLKTAPPKLAEVLTLRQQLAKSSVKKYQAKNIRFSWKSGMLFITLPSGRQLAYVKPRIGENQCGGDCVTYMGVGGTKKWERLESYGPKFVENIVQAIRSEEHTSELQSRI